MIAPAWARHRSRLAGFFWAVRTGIPAGGWPSISLMFKGGLGDDIMCGVVARELKKRGARKIWQLTNFPEIFAGNADVIALPHDFRLWSLCRMLGGRCLELEYPHPPPRHIIATMCAMAGIRGEIELRPRIFLKADEMRAGRVVAGRQVAIQTSSLGARFPMLNKQWPLERFAAVASALKGQFDLVQLGATSDPVLDGALDLRGRTNVRQAAAILSQSQLFIGLVGGLMHMARAVECRSVIVYGGREHPAQSGYSANENLAWSGACAPCWQRDACDFDRVCLGEISTEAVIAASLRQAAKHGAPLPVDRLTL